MFICFDKTGSNISMKDDSPVGGQKYLFVAGTTPQRKFSQSEGRFIELGITEFN